MKQPMPEPRADHLYFPFTRFVQDFYCIDQTADLYIRANEDVEMQKLLRKLDKAVHNLKAHIDENYVFERPPWAKPLKKKTTNP